MAAPAESPCCVDVQEPMTIVLPQTDMTPHSAATRRGSHRLRVQIRAAAATPGGGWSSDGVGSLDADVLATEAVARAGWRHVSLSHWWCWMTTLVGASEHGVKKPRYRRLQREEQLDGSTPSAPIRETTSARSTRSSVARAEATCSATALLSWLASSSPSSEPRPQRAMLMARALPASLPLMRTCTW